MVYLTNEQREAIDARCGDFLVVVHYEERGKVYWLVALEDVPKLGADHVAAEVNRGLNAIDRGEVVEWNSAAMRRHAEETAARHADDDLIDEGV